MRMRSDIIRRAKLTLAALAVGCGTPNPSGPQVAAAQPPRPASPSVADLTRDALRLLKGDGVARDRAGAFELFAKACELGDRGSCIVLVEASPEPTLNQSETARAMLAPFCLAGDLESCRGHYGSYNEYEETIEACRKGFAVACTTSGDVLKGCQQGDPHGCLQAADVVEDSTEAERWYEQGIAMFRRNCRSGIGRDCATLAARAHVDDETRDRLKERARELLLPDCRGAQLDACGWLWGDWREPPTAIELEAHWMGCYLGDGSVCRTLVARLRNFRAEDLVGLRLAYELTCLEHRTRVSTYLEEFCVGGAVLYLQDDPVAGKDRARAEAMLRHACELGYAKACDFQP
jgi:TPR repeat protein